MIGYPIRLIESKGSAPITKLLGYISERRGSTMALKPSASLLHSGTSAAETSSRISRCMPTAVSRRAIRSMSAQAYMCMGPSKAAASTPARATPSAIRTRYSTSSSFSVIVRSITKAASSLVSVEIEEESPRAHRKAPSMFARDSFEKGRPRRLALMVSMAYPLS